MSAPSNLLKKSPFAVFSPNFSTDCMNSFTVPNQPKSGSLSIGISVLYKIVTFLSGYFSKTEIPRQRPQVPPPIITRSFLRYC